MVLAPSAAVVICAYTLDRWDDSSEAVASAALQEPAPAELWLVVDHNLDLLERADRDLRSEFPSLQITANLRKQGLSGARNTALELVTADIVVFLDDDAAAEPGWLALLLAPYADPSVTAVGGAAVPRWSTGQRRPATLPVSPHSGRGELDWVVGCTYAGQPEQVAAVRNLMGCNMSFRGEVFPTIGGFSEDLGRVGKTPLGCEETELCIRARAARPDSRILFEPRALVHHHVSSDRLTWRYLRRRCYAEGVSKAAVALMVGQDRALDTERRYVARVLPAGVVREFASGRLSSAFAIVLGLATAAAGYARGRLTAGATRRATASAVPQLALRVP